MKERLELLTAQQKSDITRLQNSFNKSVSDRTNHTHSTVVCVCVCVCMPLVARSVAYCGKHP